MLIFLKIKKEVRIALTSDCFLVAGTGFEPVTFGL
jgi:hypothetical protein